jgi:predicted TPR repeat methyltransferase
MTLPDALAFALEKHRARDLCQAEYTYLQILRDDPNHFDALDGLGVLLHQTGRRESAAEHLAAAVQVRPGSAEARLHFANVLLELGNLSEAALQYKLALDIAPDNPKTWNNLGSALAAMRQMPEAEACFRRAIEMKPDYFQALHNLANAIANPGRYEEAAQFCRRALALQPDDPPSRYLLAALTGESLPATAPRGYVVPMFDSYAHYFDEQLVGELQYRGPELLRAAVNDAPGSKSLDILDIGCGTGLCGRAFHDLARTLTGVDLSAPMLQRAQARGIYDRLMLGDLLNALTASPAAFDLILAGDVFIYVGDLARIFPAARAALRSGGRFLFIVEAHAGEGFALLPSRRYAHSVGYIQMLAGSSGFVEESMREAIFRVEHGQAIHGTVHLLRAK